MQRGLGLSGFLCIKSLVKHDDRSGDIFKTARRRRDINRSRHTLRRIHHTDPPGPPVLKGAGEILRAIRALPSGELDDILCGGTPIILAPHPDDEVIGCGALIAASARAGRAPVIVYVTDGSGSHPNSRLFPRPVLTALRQHEACLAADVLGVISTRMHFMGLRDTAAPQDGPELSAAVATIVGAIDRDTGSR